MVNMDNIQDIIFEKHLGVPPTIKMLILEAVDVLLTEMKKLNANLENLNKNMNKPQFLPDTLGKTEDDYNEYLRETNE